MKDSSKREMGFYMLAGASILCLVVSYKLRSIWYIVAGIVFAGAAAFAFRKLQEARFLESKQNGKS